jgi:hypothetical protein
MVWSDTVILGLVEFEVSRLPLLLVLLVLLLLLLQLLLLLVVGVIKSAARSSASMSSKSSSVVAPFRALSLFLFGMLRRWCWYFARNWGVQW